MSVSNGDTVKVEYTGKLSDGSVFDSSEGDEPLEFTLGEGQLIPGFEDAVEGMEVAEEKTVTIEADDAYGQKNDDFIQEFPKDSLPDEIPAEKGQQLQLQNQDGQAIPGMITQVTDDKITVDMNHPLAGKDLTFDIKVVDIQ
ncbi:MAG: FKBP-type 16 kDa peptidyl-prolyl cis-trans isomerase [Candidatus Marinimicrobia bacterium]|nr:FKBP-type 16 kDa peptidyl-prolyl cis-trans isomerase [Candidatus Neomarinimicrobiota bacterium]